MSNAHAGHAKSAEINCLAIIIHADLRYPRYSRRRRHYVTAINISHDRYIFGFVHQTPESFS